MFLTIRAHVVHATLLALRARQPLHAQSGPRQPILDMHMHAREAAHDGPAGIPLHHRR